LGMASAATAAAAAADDSREVCGRAHLSCSITCCAPRPKRLCRCLQVRDERNFGSSLSPCPKLETIQCYKLWGLGGTVHELRLPECREISFWRCAGAAAAAYDATAAAAIKSCRAYGAPCMSFDYQSAQRSPSRSAR
jgi:hypothetical protein